MVKEIFKFSIRRLIQTKINGGIVLLFVALAAMLIANSPLQEYYNILKQKRGSLVAKRVFDIVMSLILLVVLSPFMLIIAIAVKGSSPGEVIFHQTRVTTYGKRFQIYKFRTMVSDAPQKGSQVTVSGDSRVTGVGHFLRKVRLDELPQLMNILKGDMSIVGNRPLPLYEAELLTSDEHIDRFMGPAGLTGLWQVEKRGEAGKLSAEERKQLDIKYAKTFSFWLDIKIILKTVTAFIQKENV